MYNLAYITTARLISTLKCDTQLFVNADVARPVKNQYPQHAEAFRTESGVSPGSILLLPRVALTY